MERRSAIQSEGDISNQGAQTDPEALDEQIQELLKKHPEQHIVWHMRRDGHIRIIVTDKYPGMGKGIEEE